MDDFSSQINEKLVPSTSNETLNCNSTVGSLEDVYNTNQLVKHCDSVPSEYSEPSVFSCNQSFDKFEVKQSKDVHIGTSYHCSSVHVYEAVPSSSTVKTTLQSSIPEKSNTKVWWIILVTLFLLTAFASSLGFYLYFMHNVKPVSNYTLHENKWLQIKGLIKENFSTPIEVIYFDDFLDFSSDENCEAQSETVKLNFHVCPNAEIYEDSGFNVLPYNYVTNKTIQEEYKYHASHKQFFRFSLVGECGLNFVTETQTKVVYNFIETQIAIGKVSPQYKLWVDRIVKNSKCVEKEGYEYFLNEFKPHLARTQPTSRLMNVNILRIGRIVSKYFDIVRYIIDNNHEQDVKEYKLLGLYKFLHFQDFCHNLFSIMNTNKTTKPVLNKKITMEVLGMEQFLGSQSSEDDVKIMDKKFAPLRRDHPQLDFNSDMRSTYNLKMFSFYKIAFFNFYPIVNEFMKIYYDFSEILTGVNRINLKLDSFRIIYEMLSKSLAGMRKMLELYRDPIYSKSFIKVLSTNFIHGVNYYKLENVLYPLIIKNICPSPNGLKAYPECLGKLYDCEMISNESCRCICDSTDDYLNTKRYFYTGLIKPQDDRDVIIGVRFKMVKGTIFLQIKTGTLLPFAAALKNQKWQALPKDDIQNRVEMNHFHRKMEMVDLTLDVEYVLTGVRMYMNKENIISVKIFGTAYRFATGKLANKTIEGQPRKRNAPKETVDVINKIPLIDVNTTILTNFNSIPKNYNTVRFGISKDGNEFLPYFDGQDVDLKDASALSGLELFYYYTEGYGGFIKPRISTVSYYDGLEGIYQSTDYVEFINVSLD